MLKLVIEDDEGRKTVVPFVRDEITIGRQEGNTIRLTERNVSRRHARLLRQNGAVLVEDLGSYNGIRLNGERIQGQVPVKDGDLIQIGDYDLAIQRDAGVGAAPPSPPPLEPDSEPRTPVAEVTDDALLPGGPPTLPLMPVSSLLTPSAPAPTDGSGEGLSETERSRRQSTSIIRLEQVETSRPRQVIELDPDEAPRLVVLNSDFAGREFACIRTDLRLGRADDNDIALDHRSLSRTHCKLMRDDQGEWRIIDLESANGLQVNGEPYGQATLRSGDLIELGHLKLKFLGPGQVFQFVPGAYDDTRGPKRRARAPLLILALLLLAGAGGAAWLWLQQPQKDAPAQAAPPARPPPPAAAPAVPAPDVAEEQLADAREAINAGDWDQAKERLLLAKGPDGTLRAEAKELLERLDAEREQKGRLDLAERQLVAGKLEEARRVLEQVGQTQLLAKRHEALRQGLATAVAAKAGRAIPPATRKAPEPAAHETPERAVGGAPAQRLWEGGIAQIRAKQFKEARVTLERCVKVDPLFAPCHKALGVANAQLGDSEKGAFHYRRFLQLAPNDKDADKVRNILEAYEQTK